jgi:hypothetical protein
MQSQIDLAAESLHRARLLLQYVRGEGITSSTLSRALVDILRALRAAANRALMQGECTRCITDEVETCEVETLQRINARLAGFERTAQLRYSYTVPAVGAANAERAKLLRRDADAIETAFSGDAARGVQLLAAVRELRSLEQSAAFQRALLLDRHRVSGESAYTISNFAYGTTPFASWLRVAQLPLVASAAQRARACGGTVVVLGSSTGLLALYGSMFWGIATLGVELLPSLVAAARRAAAASCASRDQNLAFICGDILEFDLHDACIIMVTSQCWDVALIESLRRKLAKETRPGAVVVDYRPLLDGVHLFADPVTERIEVSWDSSGVDVYAYERLLAGGGGT